ncbi:single-stranded-DNA-specific exonuclease RecJ [Virgibacillus byunsanensis]|uniref:Single-stranded-DNA-specific exonuclease RecJ n=1 Tax=Virgibacillus byunsanensis TaxID=570945 RepID=A0ABW3LNU8_9BACI
MLQSKTRWNFPNNDHEISKWMDDSNGMSPIILDLLLQRGITTKKQATTFLSPDLANLHNPFDLESMDKATERVHKAIKNEERILVYGDYDADGVSSSTVMMETLIELGATCDFYIPNRFTEGYGPNESAFKAAAEDGVSLIITVDTGITSVHEAMIARELGIDLIITDHHEPQEELPDAYAIIHPKISPKSLFQELAGVGVAFKFAESLLGYFPEHLLDLVAIGTIADLVPLVNENRVLAYYGLRTLSTTKRPGIKALKQVCKIDGIVTEEDVGFLLGPRINAVGRLQDADLAVQLLMTDDAQEAQQIAEMIQEINKERQKIVTTIVSEAEAMVNTDEHDVIIVAKEGWNEGVLGIVASKLVRKYDRPAIVLAVKSETSEVKGSARSISAFDLFTNCMKVRELFTKFGGHSQAAGMTLPRENVPMLQSELNSLINQQLSEEDFTQVVDVCRTVSITEINEKLINEVNQLAPFGMANPKPIFHVKHIPSDMRQIGNMQKHLKVQFRDETITVDGIGFGMGNLYSKVSPKTPISVIGELSINEWNGNKKPQIVMQDMKIEERQLFDYRGKKQLNLTSFINDSKEGLVISNSTIDDLPLSVNQISYKSDISNLVKLDSLYILDLPPNLSILKEIIRSTSPSNIYAGYYIEDSAYMKAFPSREDFKWFYALVRKRNTLDLNKEIKLIMDTKSWTKERVLFISKVFFELGFVKIEKGVIEYNPTPVKKDLQESILYQERIVKADIEKILYYSTYIELKAWITNCLEDLKAPKEEVTNGL